MSNIHSHQFNVGSKERTELFGHSSVLIWFTGLSGSGKSTIADHLERKLYDLKIHTTILDGDNLRDSLNKDLSFSEEDRTENIRRVAEVAKLMVEAGLIVLASFVSPLEKDRKKIREKLGNEKYIEIFVDTPLATCENRDVKGLYAKARKGEIKDFTGISSPYESPLNPDLTINTENSTPEQTADLIVQLLKIRKIIS